MAQIGTVNIQTSSGVKEIPVFEPSDVENPVVRVQTSSGTGALNLVDPASADLPQVRIQTQNNGILAVKTTLSTAGSGDLTVSTTLNGQSAEVTVLEDTTGNGTPDNTETVALQEGKNGYSLSNIEGGTGNEYWIQTEFENSDVERTAKIDFIELSV